MLVALLVFTICLFVGAGLGLFLIPIKDLSAKAKPEKNESIVFVPNMAVCYFGNGQLSETHAAMFKDLRAMRIDFSIFIHTWKAEQQLSPEDFAEEVKGFQLSSRSMLGKTPMRTERTALQSEMLKMVNSNFTHVLFLSPDVEIRHFPIYSLYETSPTVYNFADVFVLIPHAWVYAYLEITSKSSSLQEKLLPTQGLKIIKLESVESM